MSLPPYDPDRPPRDPGYGFDYGVDRPGYGVAPPPVKNYLVPAILATIFCCWPLGIPAIVYAARVDGLYSAGDYTGAQQASRKARLWAIWSVVGLLAVLLVYAVIFAVGAVIANTHGSAPVG